MQLQPPSLLTRSQLRPGDQLSPPRPAPSDKPVCRIGTCILLGIQLYKATQFYPLHFTPLLALVSLLLFSLDIQLKLHSQGSP